MTTLRDVLREAFDEVTATEPDDDGAPIGASLDDFAIALQSKLHDHGFAIHDVARCVRPVAVDLGRPMSDDELRRLTRRVTP